MPGFSVVPEVWSGAGKGVGAASGDLARGVDAFCRAVTACPFGSDDLGKALFEGEAGAPGFVGPRDDLLDDLVAAVNLVREMGAGLADAGAWYAEADGVIADGLGGRRLAGPRPPRAPAPYALPETPHGLPSTVPAPPLVRQAQWFFEAVGVGCTWPDGDLDGMNALRDAAMAMGRVADQAAVDVAAYTRWVTTGGAGAATDAFGSAARAVYGEDGWLEDLRRRSGRLAAYCQTAADATVKARWHFLASSAFVLALISAASVLGPLSGAALTPLIRLEGLALRVTLRIIREAALGTAFSGGLDVIDQLFRTGDVDLRELAGAVWQGMAAGAMMGGAHASLPSLLRRAPALTGLADAYASPGWKSVAPRLVIDGSVGTATVAAAGWAGGDGWDLEHAAETGFGVAFGAELAGTVSGAGLRRTAAAEATGPYWLNSPGKRRQDIKLTTALLPICGIPVAAGASLKFLEDRRTPLFSQWRVGKDGVPFRIHKLRTMTSARGTDASLGSGDPRATTVGRVLRKFTIDELPQLANILKGEMSLVGPRPLLAGDIETMARVLGPSRFGEWYEAYTGTRPGLISMFGNESVGLAPQSDAYLRRRAELDIEYFHHASPALDRKIVKETLDVGLSFVRDRSHGGAAGAGHVYVWPPGSHDHKATPPVPRERPDSPE
ncbi:sugar transferase [Actinomadura sp. DC4]|uniref:sugar transferase n=1 Tax=Actinomadura sp. DC4 TaxID=3055069 RepID=UPI0025B1C0FA|nr:sugar transferase [Actinomadura sp. DC4]MDN3358020.1 sugar transferase [Actinomadura sp. DC4]